MKKGHHPISDSRSESSELATRLYRLISDVVRHLDDQRARAESARELFSPNCEVQRVKLRDYCDKLMFTDPINYGRKAEELLWRKGFYDVVTTVKRLNKAGTLDQLDVALVKCHLQSGIGHYHHLVMKLQSHYRLDLRGIVDFPLLVTDHGLKKDKNWWSSKAIESAALEWAHQAIHRCLIYLGDLSRYVTDIDSTNDHNLASRYYAQALNWKPECGMPHNQLGTLNTGKNYGLDSAYNYMRCLSCVQKFEGAEGNLQHLLENNARTAAELKRLKETPALQKLILGFIQITHSLFYDKQYGAFSQLCNEAMTALNICLTEMEPSPVNGKSEGESQKLNDDILFKMVVISIMCVERLKSKGSPHTMGGVALSLSLISQVIQCAVTRLELVLPQRSAPLLKNGFKQRRRRRRRRSISHASSDMSEDDTESICSLDSNISEEGLIFDHCNDSDDEFLPNGNGLEKNKVNGLSYSSEEEKSKLSSEHNGIIQPWHHPILTENKAFQHIHRVCRNGYIMQSIKVCCDWLSDNIALVKSCGPSCGLLISRLVALLNHISAVPNLKNIKDNFEEGIMTEELLCSIALPEDVNVRGLIGLQTSHTKLNWNFLKTRVLEAKQETYARTCKLVKFGITLAQSGEVGLNYNEPKQWFNTELLEKNGIKPQENGRNGTGEQSGDGPVKTQKELRNPEKLMQEMGQLWLKAEVSELETKMKKVQTASLPPYLVLDAEAFIYHPSLVKQLASAKKFILVIPTVVVSALDEQKRSSGRVRDTIRWLESQLKQGNRFLRAQRSNEHLPLPLIKYPKKKDKEALMFFHIVECCHFLSQQSTGNKDSELVTLITGSKSLTANHQTGFSPLGVAKSTGVNVEHIEAFYSKWKSSSKSHG